MASTWDTAISGICKYDSGKLRCMECGRWAGSRRVEWEDNQRRHHPHALRVVVTCKDCGGQLVCGLSKDGRSLGCGYAVPVPGRDPNAPPAGWTTLPWKGAGYEEPHPQPENLAKR